MKRRNVELMIYSLCTQNRSESILGHPEYKTTMRLTITNVEEEDENSYKCVAKNPRGESEGTIRLYCEYLLTILPSSAPDKFTEDLKSLPMTIFPVFFSLKFE